MNEWSPRGGEIVVPYDAGQRQRYEAGLPSDFDEWAWPSSLLVGRNNRRDRCFPEVAARAYFERSGYSVLLSSPKYPDDRGFILFHYSGLRRRRHTAFRRMQEHFPEVDLHQLAEDAMGAKLERCSKRGGGDPDLFVYKPGTGERFFVEAKYRDTLLCSQLVCFPLIEERLACVVKVVRVAPRLDGLPNQRLQPTARRQDRLRAAAEPRALCGSK